LKFVEQRNFPDIDVSKKIDTLEVEVECREKEERIIGEELKGISILQHEKGGERVMGEER
jgi:hypothetical protein